MAKHSVYTICERTDSKGNVHKHWLRLGAAFINRDGSLNILLDALPVNGTLHVREDREQDGEQGEHQERDPGQGRAPTPAQGGRGQGQGRGPRAVR